MKPLDAASVFITDAGLDSAAQASLREHVGTLVVASTTSQQDG